MKFDANNDSLMNIKYQTNNIKKTKNKTKTKTQRVKKKVFFILAEHKMRIFGVIPFQNARTLGEKSYSFMGPTVWNDLSFDIGSINTTSAIRQGPKTHLFKGCFPSD